MAKYINAIGYLTNSNSETIWFLDNKPDSFTLSHICDTIFDEVIEVGTYRMVNATTSKHSIVPPYTKNVSLETALSSMKQGDTILVQKPKTGTLTWYNVYRVKCL